jgi:hypothetical protein
MGRGAVDILPFPVLLTVLLRPYLSPPFSTLAHTGSQVGGCCLGWGLVAPGVFMPCMEDSI